MIRFVRGLIGLGVFLAIWELACAIGALPNNYLPPPSTTLPRLGELLITDTDFQLDTIATVLAFLISVGLATLIAVPLGLLLGSVRGVRVATRTLVELLRPIPPVALIPLVILLLGSGPETKITLATYASVWPILFNTIYALDEMDPLYRETARSFGLSPVRTMFAVALPHAGPFVATGVRVSASIALVVVVTSEFLTGSGGGVGAFLLKASSGVDQMDYVIAGTVVIGLVGYLINFALSSAQRRLFRWNTTVEVPQ